MSFVYLAVPMDAVTKARDYNEIDQAIRLVTRQLESLGHTVFHPDGAYSGGDDKAVSINEYIIAAKADALVAIYPSSVSSVGIPLEIDNARQSGIPVLVWRDSPSLILAGMGGVLVFHELQSMLDAMGRVLGGLVTVGTSPLVSALEERGAIAPDERPLIPVKYTGWGHAPRRGYHDDAGFDLTYGVTNGDQLPPIALLPGDVANVPAHVSVQWPPGVWAMLVGRSSSFNRGLLINTAIIDPGFRGPLFAITRNVSNKKVIIESGERIAQLIPMPALAPQMEMVQVDQLSPSERGVNGFGSTGL